MSIARLPRGCSFERSKIEWEGQTVRRIFYDEEGNVIHVASMRVHEDTGIKASISRDPAAYHREYYHKVRRQRDGRTPRVKDDVSKL